MSVTNIDAIDETEARFIDTPGEFYSNPPKTDQFFIIKCSNCGKPYGRKFNPKRVELYTKMLCVRCEQTLRMRRSTDKPILVKTKDEVAALPSTQSFKFICIHCGKEIVIKSAGKRASEWFSGFCVSCASSIRNKRHTDDYID